MEPLAAGADVRVEDGIGAVVFFEASGFSLWFSVWDNVEVVPPMSDGWIDFGVFSLTGWLSLWSSVWRNVEPLAAAADVPTVLWKRFNFSARAEFS